jgi:hypothetical protein
MQLQGLRILSEENQNVFATSFHFEKAVTALTGVAPTEGLK